MDFTGNMKNPFLFDDPAPPADVGDASINPFFNGGAFDYPAATYTGINPFSDQIDDSNAAAAGLFGDPTVYPTDMNPFGNVPDVSQHFGAPVQHNQTDLFGTTSVPIEQDLFGSPAVPETVATSIHHPQPDPPTAHHPPVPPARPQPPAQSVPIVDLMSDGPAITDDVSTAPGRPPPPRPPPPSKETKDLLQTVIGAMEATTDTLHEKLNTTRTPCPSPGDGAANSPSPTPDIQVTAPEKESDSFSAIFGQTIEISDQEIDEPKNIANSAQAGATPETADEFDLFGEPAPIQKPKTNQDILSLFNKPQAQSSNIDLLSDDLLSEDVPAEKEFVKDASSDLLSGEPTEDSKGLDLLSGEGESDIDATTAPEKENESAEVPIVRESAVTSESHIEPAPAEESVSPEQVSEKTDSEPTVIEADSHGANEDVNKIPNFEIENLDSASVNEEKVEAMEVFGSPEPIPPTENSEQPESSTALSKSEVTSPEHYVAAERADAEDSHNIEFNDVFASSEAPISTDDSKTDAQEVFGVTNAFDESNTFGDAPAFGDTDAFGAPSGPDPASALFGDTSGQFPSSAADALFGTSSAVPPASPAVGLFGEDIQTAPPTSPAVGLFGDSPHDTSPAAGLFGDVPTSTSAGFDIFGGDSAPAPAPSGADSTGAALFGTTAPAPNVGMSLFGGGTEATLDIFAESEGNTMVNPFAPLSANPTALPATGKEAQPAAPGSVKVATDEEFDAFSARFDNVASEGADDLNVDPFASSGRAASPWGEASSGGGGADAFGFGDSAPFDSFLAMNEPPPPPQSTPRKAPRQTSADSVDEPIAVVIKPAVLEVSGSSPRTVSPVPVLAPPPAVAANAAFTDTAPRFNPFDRGSDITEVTTDVVAHPGGELQRTDSQETPPTPLFEEDQSQPLEQFPRIEPSGQIWEMHLRQPNKKKITGQSLASGLHLKDSRGGLTNRFWKKVYVKLTDGGTLQLFNSKDDKDPFQELPLQACYSVSDIGAQQFDQFGKIFTVKVQYIFYKERPGVRPGQLSKAERLTTKLSKFAQHAIAGDYEHVKEFASDVRKLGMPVEHAPQISQLLKLGTQNYEDLKVFSSLVEEQLFSLTVHRDRALNYKSEEVQLTAVDEIYVEQDLKGIVHRMIARVRIFFLGFLSGMPDVDLGINDMRKQGREVVGRHDIIPVITEEWIRLEAVEFHCCVNKDDFEKTQHIKFKPPDACYIELMRFRVRPPKNRELPLQIKTKITIQGRRVDIFCDILVPGFSGRKLGQVPCEDIMVRFPLPECWIYLFRVEKHFRYGSVKSAHRRQGKVKGIERLKGAVETAESALMEVTSGQAKYEHQHRAVVWRMARLPKEGQGAYTNHTFSCRMNLTAYDQMPESLDKYCYVEFTMPATTVSHCVMRSVSITTEEPPEKYVRYLARHEYRIEMEFSSGTGPSDYIAATMKTAEQQQKEEVARKQQEQQQQQGNESSSDDSS